MVAKNYLSSYLRDSSDGSDSSDSCDNRDSNDSSDQKKIFTKKKRCSPKTFFTPQKMTTKNFDTKKCFTPKNIHKKIYLNTIFTNKLFTAIFTKKLFFPQETFSLQNFYSFYKITYYIKNSPKKLFSSKTFSIKKKLISPFFLTIFFFSLKNLFTQITDKFQKLKM